MSKQDSTFSAATKAHREKVGSVEGTLFRTGLRSVADTICTFNDNGLRVRYKPIVRGRYEVHYCYTTTRNDDGKYVAYQEVHDTDDDVGSVQFAREYKLRCDAAESMHNHHDRA